jgi:hypothetical protein
MDADRGGEVAQRCGRRRALVQEVARVAQPGGAACRLSRVSPAGRREELKHQPFGRQRPAVVARPELAGDPAADRGRRRCPDLAEPAQQRSEDG